MGKKTKTRAQQIANPTDVVVQLESWDHDFEDADHNEFIRMAAESNQAAMNIAAAKGDHDGLVNASDAWGRLAALKQEIDSDGKKRIGFGED